MDDPAWLVRELVWYDRRSERLKGRCRVPNLFTADICSLWRALEHGSPMLDSLPVGPEQAAFLNRLVPVRIYLRRYDYFLESCTDDWDRTVADGGFMGQYPAPCGFLEPD